MGRSGVAGPGGVIDVLTQALVVVRPKVFSQEMPQTKNFPQLQQNIEYILRILISLSHNNLKDMLNQIVILTLVLYSPFQQVQFCLATCRFYHVS